jgi:hypothetical protein
MTLVITAEKPATHRRCREWKKRERERKIQEFAALRHLIHPPF